MAGKTENESADESKASDSSITIGNDKDTQAAVEQSTVQSSKQSKVASNPKRSKDADVVEGSSTTTSSSSSSSDGGGGGGNGSNGGTGQLNAAQLEAVLKNNPALKSELGGLDEEKLREKMKGMGIEDLLTGTVRVQSTIQYMRRVLLRRHGVFSL